MKTNTLVGCAVAAAIAAASGAAHATAITNYASNESSNLNVNVYISGSTAVTNTLNSVIQNATLGICQSGTVNEYQDRGLVLAGPNPHTGTIGGAIETMWYCQAGSASGVSTNLYLAIFKEDTAGSINGAQPLIAVAKGQSSNLTFLNPEGPDVQAGTCADYLVVTGGNHGTDGGCTVGDFSDNVIPAGGVADVEANLLRKVPGGGQLSASDISTYLSGAPGLDIVWGLGVTKNLYYALQSAEGLTSSCPTTGLGKDSPSCAPTFSKAQVASILDGDVTKWSQLGLTNSTDPSIHICRRDVGSGTEASFEAYFLGARCSTSALAMAVQNPPRVVEEASTGNILNCMEAFDLGGITITPYNGDFGTTYQPFTPTGGSWAVGILSTELTSTQINSYDTTADGGNGTTRMVAIDGVLPTIENVANGYDPYWGTDVWYSVPTTGTQYNPLNTPYPTAANPTIVFGKIQSFIGHPTPTVAADSTYENVWGDGGDMSPAKLFLSEYTETYPVTPSEAESQPINPFTKASTGSVNNCSTPVLYTGVATSQSAPESTLLGSGPNVNQ